MRLEQFEIDGEVAVRLFGYRGLRLADIYRETSVLIGIECRDRQPSEFKAEEVIAALRTHGLDADLDKLVRRLAYQILTGEE